MHWGIVKRAPRLALAPPPPPPPPASCPQIVPQPVDNSHTAVVLFPHAHDTTPMVLWADGRFADDEFAVVGRDWELWWDGVLREPPRESGLWLWSGLAEPCGDGGEFVVVASAYRRLATSEMLRLCMIGKV
ncbi:MAG: hypothetical protein CMB99_01200 [Flavobacteriaceae bacterium]|nr:hypothetical protein [Flavobacteriaceae bacterium]